MIKRREESLISRFLTDYPKDKMVIYGPMQAEERVGIFSFNIKHKDRLIHPNLVVQLLNDIFGI